MNKKDLIISIVLILFGIFMNRDQGTVLFPFIFIAYGIWLLEGEIRSQQKMEA